MVGLRPIACNAQDAIRHGVTMPRSAQYLQRAFKQLVPSDSSPASRGVPLIPLRALATTRSSKIVQLTRRNAQLITSVRLTETVLHGPSRLTAVPGLKSPRAIISAWTGVPVPEIVRMGYRLVRGAACRRGNAQFDTERRVDMACAPIGQRGLHFLLRNSA
jgi:hypothetical protein